MHVDTSSHKLKVDQKAFWRTWSKMAVASLFTGHWNWLYLKNELMEWTDVLHAAANSAKLRKAKSYFIDFWVGMVRNERGRLLHETLKSAVSKEWVYELGWFFPCWLWGSNVWLDRHHTPYLWLLNASLLKLCLLDPKQ